MFSQFLYVSVLEVDFKVDFWSSQGTALSETIQLTLGEEWGKTAQSFLPSAFIKCQPQWDVSAPCRWLMFNWWMTSEYLLPCPPGFSLNSFERICGCEPRLQKYTTRCNIAVRTMTHEGEYWVGYDSNSQSLILHPHCPFDYCKPATDHISFPLNNTDLQCANNRSGLLCSQCKPGLSLNCSW